MDDDFQEMPQQIVKNGKPQKKKQPEIKVVNSDSDSEEEDDDEESNEEESDEDGKLIRYPLFKRYLLWVNRDTMDLTKIQGRPKINKIRFELYPRLAN